MDPQLLLIIEIGLICLGLLGCILPGLPGLPLVYGAVLLQHFFDASVRYPLWLLILITILVIGVLILQYLIPIWGTKKFGASKYAIRGSIIGLILGIFTTFLGPLGIVFGPFVGAFLGEFFFAKKSSQQSFRAGWGAVLGILASSVMELIFSVMLAILFVVYQ